MKKSQKKNEAINNLIGKEHEGKWVAITPCYDKVVAYSERLIDLKKQVKDRNVVYIKPLLSDRTYAFICG